MSGRGNVSSTSSGARDRALAGRGIQHEVKPHNLSCLLKAGDLGWDLG